MNQFNLITITKEELCLEMKRHRRRQKGGIGSEDDYLGHILLERSFYRKDITVSYICLSSKQAAPKRKVGGSTVNSMKVEGGPSSWLCKF